jgi:hypothetical protein
MLAVNGIPDHLQILIGLRPSLAISDLVQDIKFDTNEYLSLLRKFAIAFKEECVFQGV